MKTGLSRFLQHRINLALYLTLGWSFTRIFIFILGYIYYFFQRGERARIETSLEEAIGRSNPSADLAQLTNDVFSGIMSHYYEKLYMAFEEPARAKAFLSACVDSGQLDKIREAMAGGKGVILVTGHYGAIEYIPVLMAANGLPVSMIAKFKTEHLKRQAFSRAADYGITLIDAEGRGGVLRCAIEELRKNRIVVTQCDEISEWKPSPHEAMTFLGKRTGADRTITLIQKRTEAAVVFGVLYRKSLKSYKLIVKNYDEMKIMMADTEALSQGTTVLKCLENYIYRYPAQWYEWKKYPEIGEPAITGCRAMPVSLVAAPA